MRRITLGLAIGLAIGLGAARAEGIAPEVARMRGTPAYAKAILDAAYATPGFDRCPRARAALGDEIGLVEGPIKVDSRGRPMAGAWIEHVAVTGCGAVRQLNVLAFVQTPGALASLPLLPGTTRADPLLQRDAEQFAIRYAAIAAPGACDTSIVADTRYGGPQPGEPAIPGKPGWLERWSVERCGKRTEVGMRFTPDATGTSIGAGAAP